MQISSIYARVYVLSFNLSSSFNVDVDAPALSERQGLSAQVLVLGLRVWSHGTRVLGVSVKFLLLLLGYFQIT
jgi:hypothetical protein